MSGRSRILRTNLRIPASVAAAVAGSQAVINASGIAFQRGRQRYEAVHVDGRASDCRGRQGRGRSASGAHVRHRRRPAQFDE
jgi:NADH dehydrogenase